MCIIFNKSEDEIKGVSDLETCILDYFVDVCPESLFEVLLKSSTINNFEYLHMANLA